MVRARVLLAQLVDPFDAYSHPTGGTELRARLRRPHVRRKGATPPDFDVVGKNVCAFGDIGYLASMGRRNTSV